MSSSAKIAQAVTDRYLGEKADPTRVASRFLEATEAPTWEGSTKDRPALGVNAREGMKDWARTEIDAGQKALKAMVTYLKKAPQFAGYKVDLKEEGIKGGEYAEVTWKGSLYLDGKEAIEVKVVCSVRPKEAPRNNYGIRPSDIYGTRPSTPTSETWTLLNPRGNVTFVPGYDARWDVPLQKITTPEIKRLLDKYGLDKLLDVVGGPKKGKHTGAVTADAIKKFVENQRTWFRLDHSFEDESKYVSYATRQHGERTDRYDRAGKADIEEGQRLKALLRAEFGQAIEVDTGSADEWVSLHIKIK